MRRQERLKFIEKIKKETIDSLRAQIEDELQYYKNTKNQPYMEGSKDGLIQAVRICTKAAENAQTITGSR